MSDSLHVGMVLPFSGPGGQYGPSAQAVTELAIEDINATGGILGRKLSPVWTDGGRPQPSSRTMCGVCSTTAHLTQ